MKKVSLSTFIIAIIFSIFSAVAQNPKREFRGAWLHTVYQEQYLRQSTAENKAYLRKQLDKLQAAGVNAVIFQVRPQSDAFYVSDLEPWSRFLTPNGQAPKPFWDPLEFMVTEAHARGMELHAWLNPYRVTSSKKQVLPKSHIYHKHPERFVRYDGKLYFNPALLENREFICDIVRDIVKRYDIDGIHFDDYFYPYPVKGVEFPDAKAYAKYGKGMDKGDWRRRNVDMLIEELNTVIKTEKPWIRFGVSPFGIWRNKKSDPRGSDTNGLQNYDALYADVLLWAEKGWIDYLLPQLYWDLEHKSASYMVLVDWWNKNVSNRHLYIGQDVDRTMKLPDIGTSNEQTQLRHKLELARTGRNIQGICWWPGYSVTANKGGIADSLKSKYQSTPALVPSYPWISKTIPDAVEGLHLTANNILKWNAGKAVGKATDVVKYVVYRFPNDDVLDLENPEYIVAITPCTSVKAEQPGIYVVTAVDRVNNESLPCEPVSVK